MESLTFNGDAFSEYYLTRLLWEEPRLQPLLGQQAVKASYRRSAAELLKAKRALKARHLSKSTRTLLLLPLADILGWDLGETDEVVETAEGSEDAGFRHPELLTRALDRPRPGYQPLSRRLGELATIVRCRASIC